MEGISGVGAGAAGRDMILDALRSLGAAQGGSGKGATTAEITKFLVAEHQVPSERARRQVAMALKRAHDNGELLKQGHHYMLPDGEQADDGPVKEAARRGRRRRRRRSRRRRSRSRRRRSRSPRRRSRSQGGGSSPGPVSMSPAPTDESEHIREAARRRRRRRRRRSRSRRRRSRSRSRSRSSF